MKKIFLLMLFILFTNSIYAQTQPTYTLTAKNVNRDAPDSIYFDIYLLHTNSGSTNFEYSLGQYFFTFNPGIANGGNLTYRIIDSELPVGARPRNPTVFNNELRLATNSVLGAGNGPAISNTGQGTLIVRMSLKTSSSSFASNQFLNLRWKNLPGGNPYTKVFAYVGTINTEVTAPDNHIIDDPLSVSQISSEVPERFNLKQNYPNPFNPSTKINFSVSKNGFVSLKVYDVSGKEIANLVSENLTPGEYEYVFSGREFNSGVYFYVLRSEEFTDTKRMVLIK